jgi:hypothetical protein
MSGKRKKKRGHFCWCCGRIRPNEKFSGSGHARHLCRDCSRLGKAVLDYRQDIRNLERHVTWESIIGRKRRKSFEKFLSHPDERIRKYAEQLAADDVRARALQRESNREWEETELEGCEIEPEYPYEDEEGDNMRMQPPATEDPGDDDIPF